MNALIVFPLKKELTYFRGAGATREFRAEESAMGKLPAVCLPQLDLTLACGGTGKAQFALQTQHLLDHAKWDLVICAGAAGALADELNVGDVVVATATVEHDYNNKFNARPRPKFDGAAYAITELKRVASFDDAGRVHFGIVASGDEDIIDAARRKMLREATGALAVAWEGAGGARACQFSGVPFLELRGITDSASHTAPMDFEKNLQLAMENLAVLISAWLKAGS